MINSAIVAQNDPSKYGSFRDSLRAPIHRWFTYPAGFSHKLVENKIMQYKLRKGNWIVDPFVGTGTTSLAAKMNGINSVGVEAHPFVFWIAKTKLHMEYDTAALAQDVSRVLHDAKVLFKSGVQCEDVWPELVYKCFNEITLKQLYSLRHVIQEYETNLDRCDFLKVALTATLRIVTSAGAGWPYIAPSKYAERVVQRDAFEEFAKRCKLMVDDIESSNCRSIPFSEHKLFNGDARRIIDYIDTASMDMVLTSPPYLNNYDYADRTRLETYFWGIYNNWADITREVRDHLIVAATTQIRRCEMNEIRSCSGVGSVSLEIQSELVDIIQRLSELRMVKSGKKAYDLMVAGYFEDMLKVIEGVFTSLKEGGQFILVLGDSAPYGVHVRTDELVGELAVAVGFSNYKVETIRARGGKWAGNSQRHHVPLRESVVTITK